MSDTVSLRRTAARRVGPADVSSAVPPDSAEPRLRPRAWVEQVMGMPVSIHVRAVGVRTDGSHAARTVEAAVEAAFAELRGVDARFSPYRAESELSRLRARDLDPLAGSPEMREVARLCALAETWTQGWFAPRDHEGRFDPIGLVKGWAVERCAFRLDRRLREMLGPEADVLVNAGGDIAVHVSGASAPPWLVGLEDPADRQRITATVPLRAGGVATSGSAARGDHIRDPHDPAGTPDHWHAVSVVGPSLTWADVAATAAYARGADAGAWLAALPGTTAQLVDRHGALTTITGVPHGALPDTSQARRAHW